MVDDTRQLAFIKGCEDPGRLRNLIDNARRQGADMVAEAAFHRLISLVPEEREGSVEHDFWRTVNAFEFLLSKEKGKTIQLSRTRQKVGRVGVVQTLTDWATDAKETDGFQKLLELGLPELTGEAIVLRHPDRFDEARRHAARQRLVLAGVDGERASSASLG